MKIMNKFWVFIPLMILSGCYFGQPDETIYKVLPYQEDMIGLQNLKTRVLVYCYKSEQVSVEQCAQTFEKKGYVRLTDIPRLSAEYDFLKSDTYPTRRWRKDEKIPRW